MQIAFDPFFTKLLCSFLVGGLYIAGVIRASERLGSKAGMLAGMPSTVLVSLIFIGLTQGQQGLLGAIQIMPLGLGMSSILLAGFILFYSCGFVPAFLSAFGIWLGILLPAVLWGWQSIFWSLVPAAGCLAVSAGLLNQFPHCILPPFRVGRGELAFRVMFSGGAVVGAVFLAKELGPLWGGLVASFPVASFCGLVVLIRRHGVVFASSVARAAPYGIASNIGFVVALSLFVPIFGSVSAILFSYIISIVLAIAIYRYLL